MDPRGTIEDAALGAALIAQLVALTGPGPCQTYSSDDRGRKREHYQQIESLREYAGGEIVLESIGGSFPLADLYSFSTTSPSTYAS